MTLQVGNHDILSDEIKPSSDTGISSEEVILKSYFRYGTEGVIGEPVRYCKTMITESAATRGMPLLGGFTSWLSDVNASAATRGMPLLGGFTGWLSDVNAPAATRGMPLPRGFTGWLSNVNASAFELTYETSDLLANSKLVNNILKPAREKIKNFSNEKLVSDANIIIDKLYNALIKYEVKNCEPIRAFESEDCILLEWIYKHWRIGFASDQNPKDSSWFLVSDDTLGRVNASGSLLSADYDWIVSWLIRRNN